MHDVSIDLCHRISQKLLCISKVKMHACVHLSWSYCRIDICGILWQKLCDE